MTVGNAQERPCPYVGPRAFTAGEPLYGRDAELQDLLDLVIAERVVVLHSPSGAGKSSLLQAGLVPRLLAEGFEVGPVMRVGLEPPAGAPADANRYTLSALLSLGEEADMQVPVEALARQTIGEYLERRRAPGASPRVLIFDQFEEVLTVAPADHEGKLGFFAQLGAALLQRDVWAVLALREDHLAALEPYRRLLPTRMRTTYRLDLLTAEAALLAIQAPARAAGVVFTDQAARKLVDDLRLVKVMRPGAAPEMTPGRHVEPVQLQVVCRRLWERLPADDTTIDLDDLAALGDVDQALADYCDAAIAPAARAGAPERLLRGWLQRNLVTEAGLRTQVLLGSRVSAEIDEASLTALIDAHLLRAEQRRGVHWIELAHDRLVAPLLRSNQRWFEAHLSLLQRQAEIWDRNGRLPQLLLADPSVIAEPGLTPVEREYLEQSRLHHARERRERLQRWAIVGLLIALLAATAIGFGMRSRYSRLAQDDAERAQDVAERAAEVALARQLAAQSALQPVARASTAALLAAAASRIGEEAERGTRLLELWARFPLLREVIVTEGSMTPWAVDPGGRIAAAIDEREGLHFWDLQTHARLGPHAPTRARGVAISPTRPLAVASDPEGAGLTLWDLATMRSAGTLMHGPGFGGAVVDIEFSGEGSRFATLSSTGIAAVWEPSGASFTVTYPNGSEPVTSVAMHPDGEHMAVGYSDGRIEYGAVHGEGTGTAQLRGTPIAGLRFDPAGARLFAVDSLGYVELRIGAAGELERLRAGRIGGARFLDASDDLRSFLLRHCSPDCERAEALLWDVVRERPRAVLDIGDSLGPEPILIGASGMLLTGHADGTLRVSDPRRRPLLSAHARGVAAVVLGGDGRTVFTGGCATAEAAACGGEIQRWDPSTGEPMGAPLHGHRGGVRALALLDEDRRLVSVDEAGEVLLWTLATGEATALRGLPASGLAPALAVDAAGKVIAVVADQAAIHRIDVLAGTELASVPASGVVALAQTRDGGQLAAALCEGEGCEVVLWDPRGGEPRRLMAPQVTRLAFAPGGERLAAADASGGVRVWSLPGGEVIELRPEVAGPPAADLQVSDDAAWVATIACADAACSSGASVLHLWSAITGLEPGTPLIGHSRFVPVLDDLDAATRARRVLAFGTGAATLVSGSLDGALVWPLGPAALQEQVCTLAGRSFTASEWSRFVGAGRAYEATCEPAR